MNSTRCPIQGCTRRKGRNNLCCRNHGLIIEADPTFFERYWSYSVFTSAPAWPETSPAPRGEGRGEGPPLPLNQQMVPARDWSAQVPAPQSEISNLKSQIP